MIPSPLALFVLALAAFRLWKLAADDAILKTPRSWLVGARGGLSEPLWFTRPRVEEWLVCPWCAGFWCALGWYGAWLLWPHGVMYAAVPFAVSAAVGLLGHFTAG